MFVSPLCLFASFEGYLSLVEGSFLMCSFIISIIDLRDDIFRYMGCSESLLIIEADPDVPDLPKMPHEGGGNEI